MGNFRGVIVIQRYLEGSGVPIVYIRLIRKCTIYLILKHEEWEETQIILPY